MEQRENNIGTNKSRSQAWITIKHPDKDNNEVSTDKDRNEDSKWNNDKLEQKENNLGEK